MPTKPFEAMDYMKVSSLLILMCIFALNSCVDSSENTSNSLRKLLQLNKYYWNNCPNREKEWMERCETDAAKDWDIYDGERDQTSRSSCCYVWDTLSCKLGIARKCDNNYANQLEKDTETQYNSLCWYHSRYSASCALRWWSIMLIVIACLFLIALAAGVGYYCWRRYQDTKYDY